MHCFRNAPWGTRCQKSGEEHNWPKQLPAQNLCLFSLWAEPCLNWTLRGLTTLCPLNRRLPLSFSMFLFNVWSSQVSSSSPWAVHASELLGKAVFISRRQDFVREHALAVISSGLRNQVKTGQSCLATSVKQSEKQRGKKWGRYMENLGVITPSPILSSLCGHVLTRFLGSCCYGKYS